MIRAGTKAIARFVDSIASNGASHSDLSHLIDVRPLQSSEIDLIAAELNPARNAATHRARLKLQHDGILVYLIAWIGDTPVGHGMLLWNGPTGAPKQHLDKPCPYVEDLWVRKDLRSRGVGARMLAEMTILAISHGYDALALSVGVDNRRAVKLYKKMGFATTQIPSFTLSGLVSMANGETQFWSEKCQYMIKSLDFREDREVEIA